MMGTFLVIHILAGLVGSFLPLAVFLESYKKAPVYSVVKARFFAITSLGLLVISWITGGLYYLNIYGPAVKPRIKESYPWVHAIVMESKEHLFLFMPVLAILLVVLVMRGNKANKSLIRFVCMALILLGVAMAIGGFIISGANELTQVVAPMMPQIPSGLIN